jgi:hypothetical protein
LLLRDFRNSIWNGCVNETFTKANLAPGINQLYSKKSWPGALQVYKGYYKQPYNYSNQSAFSNSRVPWILKCQKPFSILWGPCLD